MKAEIFTLCDAATADMSGKLNILGSFDRLWFQQMPGTIPFCALAIKVRFSQIEEGAKRIRVSIMNADGQLIVPRLDAQMQIHIAPNETSATAQMVMLLPQLRLPNFGDYSIDLAVDEMQLASCPLSVRQAPMLPPMMPPPQHQPPA